MSDRYLLIRSLLAYITLWVMIIGIIAAFYKTAMWLASKLIE